jgi:arylsulfatase A-like enzyme
VVFGEVEMVDLLPTCLELAETEPGHTHFGRSLTGLFADPTVHHRDAAFCEGGFNPADEPLMEVAGRIYRHKSEIQHEMPHLVGKAECVRTSEWAYVYRHEERDELYDRSADPAETTNLLATDRAGDDDVAAVAAGLRDRLLAWMVETSDVIPWEADPRVPDIPQGWRGSG